MEFSSQSPGKPCALPRAVAHVCEGRAKSAAPRMPQNHYERRFQNFDCKLDRRRVAVVDEISGDPHHE